MATISDPTLTGVGATRAGAYTGMQEDYFAAFDDYMDDPKMSPAPGLFARKGGKKLKGRKSVSLAKTSRPQSVSAAGEGYRRPAPSTTVRINPEIIPRKILASLGSTLEVREDARAGQASWITATDDDLKGLEEQILQNYIHNIYYGRFNVLGRVRSVAAAVGSTTTLTLYPRSNRGNVAAEFWDQGLLTETMPMGVGRSIAFCSAAQGAGGNPYNVAATAVGDPQNTTSFLAAGERKITAVNLDDPENPTITVDADITGTVAAGDFIIEYGSKQYVMSGTATDDISRHHSMEGVGSAFTPSTIVSATLGLLKASYAGLRPQYISASGVARQWTDRYAKLNLRAAMRNCGRAPTHLVCTMAQIDEVEKEYAGLRRLEPVIGKVGADYTTMGIVAHGRVLKYTPDTQAIPGAMIQTDPQFSEYMENFPLGPAVKGFEKRFVAGTDQEEVVLARRGNILFSNPQGLAMTDDLLEDEWAVT